jgi:hypothetical protein
MKFKILLSFPVVCVAASCAKGNRVIDVDVIQRKGPRS